MDNRLELAIQRIETALEAPDPFNAALAVAASLRDAGVGQTELYQLFDTVRARCSSERQQDAVMDVMDMIVGWCGPHAELYPTSP